MLKKLCALSVVVFIVAMNFVVFAAGGDSVSDWTNLPGYTYYLGNIAPTKHPGTVTKVSDGINYTCDGYYKVGEKAFSGIMLNNQVDVNDFTIEFKVNKVAGNTDDGDDLWVSVALLENENCWDTLDPSFNQGMVSLIRPNTNDSNLSLFENVDGLQFNSTATRYACDVNFKPVGTFTVEFKKIQIIHLTII